MIPVAVLQDENVRLEPFSDANKAEVQQALDHDTEAWLGMVGAAYGQYFEPWWSAAETAMQSGSRIAYAVRRLSDDRIVGTTSLYEIRPEHLRCEIGSTFYMPSARGGVVNPAAKLLLLEHAFAHGMVRVEIVTDADNAASQAAIRKLGATYEGTLRQHKQTWTGRLRDTVQFAILKEAEWPQIKAGLQDRLAAFKDASGV